jgi:TM2 domain-containing membrane protein YozV
MCANHPEVPAIAYCRSCGKPLCEACRTESYGAVYCSEHAPAAAKSVSAVDPAPGFTAAPSFTAASGFTASAAPAPDPGPRPATCFAGSHYATGATRPGDPPRPYTRAAAAESPYSAPSASSPYTAPPASSHASPALALLLGTIPGVGAIYNGQYAKGLIHAIILGLLITVVSNSSNESLAPLLGILIGVWWFYMVLEAYHTARKRRDGVPVDEFSSILSIHGTRTGFPLGAIILIGLGVLLLLNTSGLVPIERIIRYWPVSLILLGVYMLYSRIEGRGAMSARGLGRGLRDEPR